MAATIFTLVISLVGPIALLRYTNVYVVSLNEVPAAAALWRTLAVPSTKIVQLLRSGSRPCASTYGSRDRDRAGPLAVRENQSRRPRKLSGQGPDESRSPYEVLEMKQKTGPSRQGR